MIVWRGSLRRYHARPSHTRPCGCLPAGKRQLLGPASWQHLPCAQHDSHAPHQRRRGGQVHEGHHHHSHFPSTWGQCGCVCVMLTCPGWRWCVPDRRRRWGCWTLCTLTLLALTRLPLDRRSHCSRWMLGHGWRCLDLACESGRSTSGDRAQGSWKRSRQGAWCCYRMTS